MKIKRNSYKIHKDYRLISLMNITLQDEKKIRVSNALLNRVNFLKVDTDIRAEKITIPGYNGFNIDLYIYKPKDSPENIPCMIYYHGGGFFMKGDALSPKILTEYIRKNRIIVVYVDYRLSIDYPYPIPLEDCYSGLKWVYENNQYLGINKDKIFLAGFSAGGALAAGVSLLNRNRKFCKLVAQILISPVTDHRQITESVTNFTDTPNWDSGKNRYMWELYLRDVKGEVPFYASPGTSPSFKDLPPAYIEVAEFDPLHDEGINYGISLKNAGIPVVINDTKGTIHMSSIVLSSEQTVKNMEIMSEFIKEYVHEKN